MATTRNSIVLFAFFSFVFCASVPEIFADTHSAASCSYADVSAAITAASAGDTVSVPAGSCTWSSTLNIPKPVSVIGNGIDSTVITCNVSPCTTINPSSYSDTTHLYRLSGMTLNQNGKNEGLEIGTYYKDFTSDTPALPKVRVDHIKFSGANNWNAQSIHNYSTMTGVVDNCIFTASAGSVYYPIRNDTGNGAAHEQHWYQYLWPHWDSGNGFLITYEDNTFSGMFDGGTALILADSQYGTLGYVFRYNSITVAHDAEPLFDLHGYFGGDMYSSFGAEIYGNQIIGSAGGNMFSDRGGKSMAFFNVGANYALRPYADTCPVDYITQQLTHDSYFFGNRASMSGSLMGVGVTKTISDTCNRLTGIPTLGRDIITDSSSPGVTCGTLANLPSTCTTGQGYWATSQSCSDLTGMVGVNPATPISGTLYKCTSTNTWTAFYTPYTYPHPLRTGGGGNTSPPPPQGLGIQ